jgi:hypothetical protein
MKAKDLKYESKKCIVEEYPIDIPAVFDEAFENPITGSERCLLKRFGSWHTLVDSLVKYFESQKDMENTVIDHCNDARRALGESFIPRSVVDAMDEGINIRKISAKFGSTVERFRKPHEQFDFKYVEHGGVYRNMTVLMEHVQQMAIKTGDRNTYLVNNPIKDCNELLRQVSDNLNALYEWKEDLQKAEMLKSQAITSYRQLVIATETFKLNRDMTPLAENDPLVCWIQYQSLRDTYLSKMNLLKTSCVRLQTDCKQFELSMMDDIKRIVHEYLDSTKSHNFNIKELFSKHKIPIDNDEEWKYYDSIDTPPCGECLPRKANFINQDHPRTRPLTEVYLLLHSSFPWSLRSKEIPKRYVITTSGYLIKAPSLENMEDATPKRAFRLRDCAIIQSIPQNGCLAFEIRGINCCRDIKSNLLDRRTTWTFSGDEVRVKDLLTEIKDIVPSIPYPLGPIY